MSSAIEQSEESQDIELEKGRDVPRRDTGTRKEVPGLTAQAGTVARVWN